MTTPPPGPTEPYAAPTPGPAPKKKLSTGAIIAIVVGSIVLLGIIGVGIILALALSAGDGVLDEQRALAADSRARADVSTLGKEIATYNVDNTAPLTIAADGDFYVLEGGSYVLEVPRSDGVEFEGFTMNSAIDWCVWVSAPEGTETVDGARYSAQHGLENSAC